MISTIPVVLIEGPCGSDRQYGGDTKLVLRSRFDLAFGVKGERLAGVGSGEGGVDVVRLTAGQGQLAEAEVQGAGAAEETSRFCLGDGADEGGALGDCDGVVGVVDGFSDGCLDNLPGGGGLG